jgi:hypothetical protein
MPTDFSLFRDRLTEACRIRGMTHVSGASELVAAAFLDLQFAGSRTLDLYRVCQIADRLDVSVDWLVGRSGYTVPGIPRAAQAFGRSEALQADRPLAPPHRERHHPAMDNEDIPENVDLRFLAEQQTRILRELAHMRQDDQARDVAIAALSVDLKATKESVEDLSEQLQIVGGRLNTIDGRLARIEKHTGLVKA